MEFVFEVAEQRRIRTVRTTFAELEDVGLYAHAETEHRVFDLGLISLLHLPTLLGNVGGSVMVEVVALDGLATVLASRTGKHGHKKFVRRMMGERRGL